MPQSARKQKETPLNEQRNKLSKSQKSCQCEKCQAACRRRPGWFKPGEAEKAAAFLGLSLEDFFKTYLAVDVYYNAQEGDDKDIFLLAPALVGQKPGDMYPLNPTGVCIFYDDGKCAIHGAHPYECARFMHGKPNSEGVARHRRIAISWRNKQKQIQKLLGRKPKAAEVTMGSMLDAVLSGMFGG